MTFLVTVTASTALAQTLFTPGATIGSSTNGNVGIGTSAPIAKLDVQMSGVTVGLRLHNSSSSTNWDLYAYNDNNFYLNNANGAVVNVFANAAAGTLYIGGNRIGVDTLNMLRPFTVEAGSNGGVNQGLVINSAHSYGVGQGTASSALVFGRNRSFDTTVLDSSAQIVGGNESETTSNNGFLSFYTVDGVGNLVERMRLDSGGHLGFGTTTPAANLDIVSSDNLASTTVATIEASNRTSAIQFGYNRITQVNSVPTQAYLALGVSNNQNAIFIDPTGNIGVGTTNPTQRFSVNGAVRAKEVIVDTAWSDYVFDDGYRLPSLAEVEAHIKAQKHLDGIPSAKEVAERGIRIGDIEAKLLAKIEELTLHQIEQEKKLQAVQTENLELRRRLAAGGL